jgi:hypothetical protein
MKKLPLRVFKDKNRDNLVSKSKFCLLATKDMLLGKTINVYKILIVVR